MAVERLLKSSVLVALVMAIAFIACGCHGVSW